MTSHTITEAPHRRLGNPTAKFEAWIKTSDGHPVELYIGAGATQEQAERFVREAIAAPELLEAVQIVLAGLNARVEGTAKAKMPIPIFEGIAALHAAIAKATGGMP